MILHPLTRPCNGYAHSGTCVDQQRQQAVLPDGLDHLPPRKVLDTVLLTTVNGAEVCYRA